MSPPGASLTPSPPLALHLTPLGENYDRLKQEVESRFDPKDRHPLQAKAGWLVRYGGTTIEVSNLLTITGQEQGEKSHVGPALVTSFASYYGRGPSDMWEWLKTRLEGTA